MDTKKRLQELKEQISKVDIAFHLITLNLKTSKISIAMAAPKEVIADYVNYQAKSEIFNYKRFLDWCIMRQVKVYAESDNNNIFSNIKAFIMNKYFKYKGLSLDEEITTLFMILNDTEVFEFITNGKTDRQKERILKHTEYKVNQIIENGY